MPRIDTIQLRRGTAAAWLAANPVLLQGEQGLETDTNKVKIGDGTTAWNALAYFAGSGGGGATAYTDLSDKITAPIASVNQSVSDALLTKAPTVSPTFTGTVSGVTKSHVGLSNVDNVSDVNKPISTAQATVNAATTATLSGKQGTLTAGANVTIVGTTISSSANAPLVTTFNAAIPFDAYRTMGENTVAAPIAFTVNATGAVDDGQTILSLIADGVNTPTFAGTLNYSGPSAYDNTAGRVNNLVFFRAFSRYYYGSILGPINDVIPPTLISATVANATPTRVDLVWSEPINSSISAAAAFTVSAHTVSAHNYVDSTHTYLTLSVAFTSVDVQTLNYAVPGTNPIKDLAVIPNLALGITGRAITNNVVAAGFTDTFTRTSASSLGTSNSGQAWTQVAGTMGTDGTKAYVVTTASPAKAWAETGRADGTWQCTFTGSNANVDYVAFLFRYSDASNYWAFEHTGIGQGVTIYKVVAGVQTSNVLFDGTLAGASGDVLKVVTSGNSITAYWNNALLGNISNVSDSFNATATKVGFISYGSNWKIDDLTVA